VSLPVLARRAEITEDLMRQLWHECQRVFASRAKGTSECLRDRTRRILSRVYDDLSQDMQDLVVLPPTTVSQQRPGPSSQTSSSGRGRSTDPRPPAQRRRLDDRTYVPGGYHIELYRGHAPRGHSASATVGTRETGVRLVPAVTPPLSTGSIDSNGSNATTTTIVPPLSGF
jgi:hypothetical protein